MKMLHWEKDRQTDNRCIHSNMCRKWISLETLTWFSLYFRTCNMHMVSLQHPASLAWLPAETRSWEEESLPTIPLLLRQDEHVDQHDHPVWWQHPGKFCLRLSVSKINGSRVFKSVGQLFNEAQTCLEHISGFVWVLCAALCGERGAVHVVPFLSRRGRHL